MTRILVVCTGNLCRSPMAEALLRARLPPGTATVTSAGTHAPTGEAAHPHVCAVMAARGRPVVDHRARLVTADLLRTEGADLVLAMARPHVRHVVELAPDAWGRTFTLRELVRVGSESGRRRSPETLGDWLQRTGADRRPQDLLGESRVDDVADPLGHGLVCFQRTADELDDLVARLTTLLAFPERPRQPGRPERSAPGTH